MLNFVPAFANRFCMSLTAAFTQPGDRFLAEPCTYLLRNLRLWSLGDVDDAGLPLDLGCNSIDTLDLGWGLRTSLGATSVLGKYKFRHASKPQGILIILYKVGPRRVGFGYHCPGAAGYPKLGSTLEFWADWPECASTGSKKQQNCPTCPGAGISSVLPRFGLPAAQGQI